MEKKKMVLVHELLKKTIFSEHFFELTKKTKTHG